MRIAIVGAGGIGGFLAARLAAAGQAPTVLARGAHLAAIRDRGMTLREPDGERNFKLDVSDDAKALGPADLVIFAVKAQHMAQAIEDARPLMGEKALALPFQNGVDATDMLAAAYGEDRALIGIARVFATITAPGVIDRVSPFAYFTIGTGRGTQDDPQIREIRAALTAAGVECPDCPDVLEELWRKFALMNPLSGITAAARCDMAAIRDNPGLWDLFRDLVTEAVLAGEAKGVPLTGVIEDTMTFAKTLPGELRASQAHDLDAGKPLEVDWLSGAVVRLGVEHGISTPASAAIAALLSPWRNGAKTG